MMQRSLGVVVSAAFIAAVCLVMLTTIDVHASSAHATADRPTGKGTCVVHNIYLNGDKPAKETCAKWSTGGISPSIYEGTCDPTANLLIVSSTQGYWCFFDTNYMGLGNSLSGNIYHVTRVVAYGNNGWIMYYNPPFTVGTGFKFGFAINTTYTNPPFNGNQKVTQVCIGSGCFN